ncbi:MULTISPECIES: hypothetical protein [unclassified Alsobacter]|jgi:hypothetical protein|uniref:Uncharacterized protein n=1 Tax=Alsobacter sp. KACC 23698 TaxID=3149229 RepID=A0AAU7JGM9_9HYPH
MFEFAEFQKPCPGCGNRTPSLFTWAKTDNKLLCMRCGGAIELPEAARFMRFRFAQTGALLTEAERKVFEDTH